MGRIVVLQPHIANQIAAGEVVERPASIVKELVENAIDAQATAITVEIQNGGIDRIRVSDNGVGIPAADCLLAFERHATSKISQADDLAHIETLGFRGEALASIAAVSQVRLTTRAAGEEAGTLVRIEGGECRAHQPFGCPEGTTIQIENVFFNVPARRKFLKAARTEAGYIADYLSRMILARPDISIKYVNNGAVVYHSPGDNALRNAVYCVYGAQVLPHLRELSFDDGYLRITGFVGTAEIARPNRMQQSFLLNGRSIRAALLSAALQRAYGTRLMSGRFPFAVVALRIASNEVDVNVHPNKLEVRFSNETRVANALMLAVQQALGSNLPPSVQWNTPKAAQTPAWPQTEAGNAFGRPAETPPARSAVEDALRAGRGAALDLTVPPAGPTRLRESAADYSARPWERRESSEALQAAAREEGAEPVPEFTIVSAQAVQEEMAAAKAQSEQQAFGLEPYAIAGQVFETYWIVQQGEHVFFIDQHAAHERILYGKFMAQAPETAAQRLLTPEIIQLTPQEREIWEEAAQVLLELGFETQAVDAMTIRVEAVPAILLDKPVQAMLREALALLSVQGRAATNALRREAIVQASCKHAVKGGDALTKEEIQELLAAFAQEGAPMTCPHGRPVMIQMSRRELEKQFKRIV